MAMHCSLFIFGPALNGRSVGREDELHLLAGVKNVEGLDILVEPIIALARDAIEMGPYVELVRSQQSQHGLPGVEHLAPENALDRDALPDDTVGDIKFRQRLAGDSKQENHAAVPHYSKSVLISRHRARHLDAGLSRRFSNSAERRRDSPAWNRPRAAAEI